MVQTLIRLPFQGATQVIQGIGGSFSHTGGLTYSYDFDLDFGQEVLAVAKGRVVAVRETIVDGGSASQTGDPSLGSSNIGNFVTLEHTINGRTFYSSYFHLRYGSVPLQVNDIVQEGDVLGQVGNTGVRTGTHLHFQFGATSILWTAGVVANAGVTTANATLASEVRFVGYDATTALVAGSSVTGGAAGDFAANTGTEAILVMNSTGSGSVGTARDMDWFRFDVEEGQSYTVTVDGAAGSSLDAYLRLYDAAGAMIAWDNDSGAGLNALLNFTANQTTALFLSAGGNGNSIGAYTVSLTPKAGIVRNGTWGADNLTGTSGNDTLSGRAGGDTLSGLTSADILTGGWGSDTLYGGSGRDRLEGGTGQDTLWGGSQADTFVFAQGGGRDVVGDFTNGSDKIALSGTSYASLVFTATANGLWIDYGIGDVYLQNVTRAQIDATDFIFA